jgi:Skp family chaperone for outer membrane proteins
MKLVRVMVCLTVLSGAAYGQTRIGTVNLQKVFDKYWKTEQASATLKDRAADLEKNHREMVDAWKKSKEEYQRLVEEASNQAISAEQRDKRKKVAEDKLRELKSGEEGIAQFERQAATSLGEQKGRLRSKILEEIRQAINSKAKAAGYTMVIDAAAQTYSPDPSGAFFTPTVLYLNDENDLTEAVLSQLNATAPVPESPKPEEKSAAPTKAGSN